MSKKWLAALLALIVAAAVITSAVFWEQLSKNGLSIRDVYLVAAGLGAVAISWWRGGIAEKQQMTAEKQERISNTRLTVERYQRGAELLGDDSITVRIAGIYALTYLASSEREASSDHGVVFDMVLDLLRRFRTTHPKSEERPSDWRVADQSISLLERYEHPTGDH